MISSLNPYLVRTFYLLFYLCILILMANGQGNKTCEWRAITVSTSVIPEPRFDHSMVSYPTSQNVTKYENNLIFGGAGLNGRLFQDLWSFDLESMSWSSNSNFSLNSPPPLSDHSVVFDSTNGEMYVFGGKTLDGTVSNNLWALNIRENKWILVLNGSSIANPIPSPRMAHTAVLTQDAMIIFGGSSGKQILNDIWKLDLERLSWQQLIIPNGPSLRAYHSCVVYQNQMLVFGGFDGEKELNDLWSFDLVAHRWNSLGKAPIVPRSGHVAVMKGNSMIVFGGEGLSAGSYSCLKDLWIYNILKFTWQENTPSSISPQPRLGARAIALSDHSKYISGKDVIENEAVMFLFGGIEVEGPNWSVLRIFNDSWLLYCSLE